MILEEIRRLDTILNDQGIGEFWCGEEKRPTVLVFRNFESRRVLICDVDYDVDSLME